jgi:hypothetical protein
MIKLSQLQNGQQRLTREVEVPFIIRDENGEERTENVRIRYYSFSIRETREYQKRVENLQANGGTGSLGEILAYMIAEIPDLVDDDGNPVPVTPELMEQINVINLRAIDRAISEDIRPK